MNKLPLFSVACLAVIIALPSASAKDKNKDKSDRHRNNHRSEVVVERTVVVDRDSDRRDNDRWDRDRRDGNRDYSYRRRYPRRVVVYQDRSYGYNYYDLQLVLQREGYYRGAVDGIWGPGSRAALVRYQTHRGWRQDDVVDGRLVLNFGLNY